MGQSHSQHAAVGEGDCVSVELFGVARLSAGARLIHLPATEAATLAAVGAALAARCPALIGSVLAGDGTLLDGHVFNLNGRDFVRDPATEVRPGDAVLIIPAAAGG